MQVASSSRVIISTLFLLLSPTLAVTLWAGQANLSWQAPTTHEDGSPATDLSSFRIHYGTQSRGTTTDPQVFQYQQTISNISKSTTTYTVTGLTEDVRYYFSVTALDTSGKQSKYSNEANLVVPTSSGGGGGGGTSSTLLSANFSTGADGFVYSDDMFRNTSQPAYASGTVSNGSLQVFLGGRDNVSISRMSGGWSRSFTIAGSTSVSVTLSFRYNLSQTPHYESDEYSEVRASLDSTILGSNGRNYVARIWGDGNGGATKSTGWQTYTATLQLNPGSHTLKLGGFNSKKTASDESTTMLFDDVLITQNATSKEYSLQLASSQQPTPSVTTSLQSASTRRSSSITKRRLLERVTTAASTRTTTSTVASLETIEEIWLEAETGHLTDPMQVDADDTATEQHIRVPAGTEEVLEASQATGMAAYSVLIETSGFYVIWGRVQADAQTPSSFFLTLDQDPALVWEFSNDRAALTSETWQWQQALQQTTPVIFLAAGQHTLTLQHRQAGVKLDRLLLTNDLDFVPQD
jgi:hypothetical protein